MLVQILLAIVLGVVAGSVVNLLADDLPYRRRPGSPTYPDGTPRPLTAWSGILAFLLNQRAPAEPQPDEARTRAYPGQPVLSWRYPLTEILTAVLMALMVSTASQNPEAGAMQLTVWLLYIAILVLVTVIDIEHKLILFVVIIPSCVLALLDAVLLSTPPPGLQDALLGAAVGFGVFFLLYQGGFLFTYLMGQMRGEEIDTVAFGYGDVMLITFSGLTLGLAHTILALFITVFLGAFGAFFYLVARMIRGGRYNAFTALPYGPYIVAATVLMLLYGDEIRLALIGY